MIGWLLNLFRCYHADSYRERRELHGYPVVHVVCPACGHAEPLVKRTAKEQQALQGAGPAYALLKAVKR